MHDIFGVHVIIVVLMVAINRCFYAFQTFKYDIELKENELQRRGRPRERTKISHEICVFVLFRM